MSPKKRKNNTRRRTLPRPNFGPGKKDAGQGKSRFIAAFLTTKTKVEESEPVDMDERRVVQAHVSHRATPKVRCAHWALQRGDVCAACELEIK